MTAPSNDELNLPAAKAVLSMLRLYSSIKSYPAGMPPTAMKRAASTYTGSYYSSGKTGLRAAMRDLSAWINERENPQ